MPAELDSIMFTGEVPWHRQGTKLDRPATAHDAITAAGLDWETQLQPMYTGPDRSVRVKNRYAVCRTDRIGQPDGGQLGVVGGDYTPLQNREAFSFLDPLVGEGAAVYHTAGSLREGGRVWMLARLPGEIRVATEDVVEQYLLLSNTHNGTSAVRIGLTPIRVVCQNTLNLALRGMHGQGVTIRMARLDNPRTHAFHANLVRQGCDEATAKEFHDLFRPEYGNRFRQITWEQIYAIAHRHRAPSLDQVCRYLETKTASLAPAFKIQRPQLAAATV